VSMIEISLRFPPTRSGARRARLELERLERVLPEDEMTQETKSVALAPEAASGPISPGKTLFDHLARTSRGRDLLRVLPEGKDNGLTPAQLSQRMPPGPNGEPLRNGSVRAIIRNLWRGAEHLKARGHLDSRVVQRHFDEYDRDRAGRYYLEPGDGEGIPGR
jgi:hypothetical protein